MILYLSPSNRLSVVVIGREPLNRDDLTWLKTIPPALEARQLEIWNAERRRKQAVAVAVDVTMEGGGPR